MAQQATQAPMDTTLFHICSRDALTAARAAGIYRAESLTHEGFIHLSCAHQVLGTARAFYAGVPDLVLLVIDPILVEAPIVYEAPVPPHATVERFPHCYGPLNLDAIIDVMDLDHFDGTAVPAETVAMLRHYRFDRLPVEGTLYRSTWRSAREEAPQEPAGTAMLGLFAESPRSVSCFHRLTHDEVWHAYAGDPFTLFLLHPNGALEEVLMGTNPMAGQRVQMVVPAGVWQAGALVPGGRYALFGCTMAPGFTPACFEGGTVMQLLAEFPAHAAVITRLAVAGSDTRMPPTLPSHA